MPVPSPNKGEVQADFISRCMSFLMGEDPKRDKKQALAIAYSQWRTKEDLNNVQLPNFHSDFRRILHTFIGQYGEAGVEKFDKFIEDNGLKLDKAYTPQAQFKESFNWTEPLISKYKQDKDAVYYKVVALTANVSMNNNDYSNFQTMQTAAPSLAYRPVNINHDPKRWLPFPRTRVDFTKAEDLSIEATLRVDNEDAWLQRKLDNGEIAQASIEARPDPEGIQHGYGFMGIALLERGVELPGDPLTEISPMFLNEKIGESMCKLINGKLTCNCNTITKEGENKTMSEVSKELSPPNTVTCPFCGQIDPLTGEDPAVQKCSKCGHGMRQTPHQDAHIGLQGGEAIMEELKVQYAKLQADSAEKEAVWVREKVERDVAIKAKDEKIIEQSEKIARLTRDNLNIQVKDEQRKVLEVKLGESNTLNEKLQGQNEAYARQIGDLEKDRNKAMTKVSQQNEKIAMLETEHEKLSREYNEESQKHAASETKALNETKERSRIQLENADLRTDIAKTTREISNLTERLASDAGKLYAAENEKKVLVTKLSEKDNELAKLNEKIKKALKFQNWAWRELQRANIFPTEAINVESAEP